MTADFNAAPLLGNDWSTQPGARPDVIDLIGPWFDRPRGEPVKKTLIICAAPRTGSYELARLLTAAGIGIPHEYFSPTYAPVVASRWGLTPSVLSESQIENYILELRCRRSAGGVFATKLQHWQYRTSLCNKHGKALFRDAVVVHLFRSDVVRQFVSWYRAIETGRYDFSDRATRPPRDPASLLNQRNLLEMADFLVAEDAGFRRLFILAKIRPIFVEFDQFTQDPRSTVQGIGQMLAVPVNDNGLNRALEVSAPYQGGPAVDQDREEVLSGIFGSLAFDSLRLTLR